MATGSLGGFALAGEAARDDLGDAVVAHRAPVDRGSGERRLEGLADLAVGVADERAQLTQRGLEVLALALELLDVRERLGVLLLGQRVDRAELLAPARQALDARAQLLGGLRLQRL